MTSHIRNVKVLRQIWIAPVVNYIKNGNDRGIKIFRNGRNKYDEICFFDG